MLRPHERLSPDLEWIMHMIGSQIHLGERIMTMQAQPNQHEEQKFRSMLDKLLDFPRWTSKQQLELEMARDAANTMLHVAETMRRGTPDTLAALRVLRLAKAVDYVLTALAAQRDIRPATLRAVFNLAGLPVDPAYGR
jgi:hypothetical protein